MHLNIDIDDDLIQEAIDVSGAETACEAVELGLKSLIRLRKQEHIRSLRGKLRWEGDLDAMMADT